MPDKKMTEMNETQRMRHEHEFDERGPTPEEQAATDAAAAAAKQKQAPSSSPSSTKPSS